MKIYNQFMIQAVLAFAFVTTSLFSTPTAQAQEEARGFILSLGESTIKPGHDDKFRDGVKAWKKCYLENGGDWTWSMWRRVQGEGTVYTLSSGMANWAEMDEAADEAGKKCRSIVVEMIQPHIQSSNYSLSRSLPAWSKSESVENNVAWVTFWQVENYATFVATVKSVQDIMRTAEGDLRSYWYRGIGGGTDSFDYFAVTPFESFTAMDVERDGVWTVVEKAAGKEKRDQLQEDFRGSVKESWSYLYTRVKDLSHNPE
jgi:hypothetical protein